MLTIAAGVNLYGFNLDLRYIPLLIGSLYGGVFVFIVTSGVYLIYQLASAEGIWNWVEIISFIVLFLPVTYSVSRMFMRSSRKRRQAAAWLLTAMSLLIISSSLVGVIVSKGINLTTNNYVELALHGLLYVLTMWINISLVEIYMERHALSRQLQNVSDKYRIEVQKLQQFIEETPLCVIFVNQSGIITHINEMAIHIMQTKIGGRGRKELIGQPFMSMYDNIDKDVVGRLLAASFGRSQNFNGICP